MKTKKLTETLAKESKENMPLSPIGVVAELIGTSKQTLRLYEKHNLIKPSRRNKHRYYSDNDIKWIQCVRELLHNKKISIEGIKKLLKYAPCWEFNSMICKSKSGKTCEDCFVFLSKSIEKKANDG